MLCHVLFHLLIISIHLLPYRSFDVAQILSAHQIELCLAFPSSIWLDQGSLLSIIEVAHILINRGDAVLQLTFLVKRGQERYLLAHLGELERLGHAFLSLQFFALQLVICFHLDVLLAKVLIVADHSLELLPGVPSPVTNLVQIIIVMRARDFLPHFVK